MINSKFYFNRKKEDLLKESLEVKHNYTKLFIN